jgi:hypothetical protein
VYSKLKAVIRGYMAPKGERLYIARVRVDVRKHFGDGGDS